MKKRVYTLIAILMIAALQIFPADASALNSDEASDAGTLPVLLTLAEENFTEFAGGHGTQDSPYRVATATHLENVRLYPDAHFLMTADIVFTAADFASDGSFYHDGSGWISIGDWSIAFAGSFDGAGHTVTGLYQSPDSYGGLFGVVSGATIKDLGMLDVYISAEDLGSRAIGGIAGAVTDGSTISGCYATGRIAGGDGVSNAGGIIGSLEYSTIIGCHSACSVSGFYAGGIVSYTLNSQVTDCFNAGPVTSDMGSGGIVAFAQSDIANCFNAGPISGETAYQTGGIAGVTFGDISCCYNVGTVTNGSAILGDSYDNLYNCYYLTGSGTGEGTACTARQLRNQTTFSGFDFTNTWVLDNTTNYPYPRLRATDPTFLTPTTAVAITSLPEKLVYEVNESLDLAGLVITATYYDGSTSSVTDYTVQTEDLSTPGTKTVSIWCAGHSVSFQIQVLEFAGGSGTQEDPYLVATAEQLNRVRLYLDAHYLMTNDITLTNSGTGWSSIGNSNAPFTGVFDGAGHTIKGLYQNISSSFTVYAGLFGAINGAQINDLSLEDVNITVNLSGSRAYQYVGGITGYAVDAVISDCRCSGTISGFDSSGNTDGSVGGLAGYVSKTTISRCVSSVDIKGNSAGGITGRGGTITDCYNTGNITSSSTYSYTTSSVGGISGEYASIFHCYNTGNITVTLECRSPNAYVGGIAGGYSSIADCFNTGALTVSVSAGSMYPADVYVGGIAGIMYSGTIVTCYNTGAINLRSSGDSNVLYTGGIVGYLEASLSECYYLNNSENGVGYGTDTAVACSINQLWQADTFIGFDFTNTWTMAGNEDFLYPELQGLPIDFTKSLVSISVTQMPSREYYSVDDTLDPTGLVITAQYDNDTSAVVTDYELTYDFSVFGEHTVTVSYGGQSTTFTVCVESADFAGGAGTENYPFLIATADQLDKIRYQSRGSYFKLIEDIAFTAADFASGGKFYNSGKGWVPISGSVSLDGDGHTISGLYVNTTESYGGLFGNVNGKIKDLHLTDVNITATKYAGGLVGGGSPSITDCSTSGTVTAKNDGAYDAYAGGIIGSNTSIGTITNCHSFCSVSANGGSSYAGGIAGRTEWAISNCSNSGHVTAKTSASGTALAFAGGITGYGYTVTACYNTGTIIADSFAKPYYFSAQAYSYGGGIIGYAVYSSVISTSYNAGKVYTATDLTTATSTSQYAYGGGILGRGKDYVSIQSCYNIGFVTSSNNAKVSCRGIVGENASVSDCYYLDHTADKAGTACTLDEMKEQSTFEGFDFANVWTMDGNAEYPYPELLAVTMIYEKTPVTLTITSLPQKTVYRVGDTLDPTGLVVVAGYNDGTTDITTDYTLSYDFSAFGDTTVTLSQGAGEASFTVCVESDQFSGGCGTAQHPFLISTTTQLDCVRNYLSSHFKLICDISFSQTTFSGNGFEPIGSSAKPFTGTFDGNGYTISGLYQNVSTQDIGYAGLFGCVERAMITDLGLLNADIRLNVTKGYYDKGYAYAGGLVGCILEDYSDTPTIIANCFFSGSVQDISGAKIYTEIGGLVGNGYNVLIANCYNLGTVSSLYGSCGGIIGYAEAMTIRNCYNAGTISGGEVGGILGECSLDGQIRNCYNSGTLLGDGSHTGGIAGFAFMTITIQNCYNVGVSGNEYPMGGITGYSSTPDMITGCYYLDTADVGILRGSTAEEDLSIRCNATEMQQAATFLSFDFVSTWTMYGNPSYPYPELLGLPALPVAIHAEKTGSGIRLALFDNEDTVSAEMNMIVATYNSDGKQLSTIKLTAAQLQQVLSADGLQLPLGDFHYCKIFLLDRNYCPITSSASLYS